MEYLLLLIYIVIIQIVMHLEFEILNLKRYRALNNHLFLKLSSVQDCNWIMNKKHNSLGSTKRLSLKDFLKIKTAYSESMQKASKSAFFQFIKMFSFSWKLLANSCVAYTNFFFSGCWCIHIKEKVQADYFWSNV